MTPRCRRALPTAVPRVITPVKERRRRRDPLAVPTAAATAMPVTGCIIPATLGPVTASLSDPPAGLAAPAVVTAGVVVPEVVTAAIAAARVLVSAAVTGAVAATAVVVTAVITASVPAAVAVVHAVFADPPPRYSPPSRLPPRPPPSPRYSPP